MIFMQRRVAIVLSIRLFSSLHAPLGLCKNKTALAQKNSFRARADKSLSVVPPCLLCISLAQPLCREPTFPCPVTGAPVSGYSGLAFSPCPPRTIVLHRSASPFQRRGLSVAALTALLSLHWFEAFIPHRAGFVNAFGEKSLGGLALLSIFRRCFVDFIVRVEDQKFLGRLGHRRAVLQHGSIAGIKGAILSIQHQQQVFARRDLVAQPTA